MKNLYKIALLTGLVGLAFLAGKSYNQYFSKKNTITIEVPNEISVSIKIKENSMFNDIDPEEVYKRFYFEVYEAIADLTAPEELKEVFKKKNMDLVEEKKSLLEKMLVKKESTGYRYNKNI